MAQHTRICQLLVAAILGVVAGCATNTAYFQSKLDSTSGVTVSSLPEPLTLARAAPRISASARDYVYLGPVEINRMGNKEFYLWVGLASTVDRQPLGEAPVLPTDLLIVADGVPMSLSLEDWNPGTMGADPYEVSTSLYHSLQARLAKHQLAVLARANLVQVYLQAEQTPAARYDRWSGSLQDWAQGTGEIATAERQ